MITTQARVNLRSGDVQGWSNKTTRNIRIYNPHVFHVGSGPNQSYYPECDCKRLSPSFTRKVKGRTQESI